MRDPVVLVIRTTIRGRVVPRDRDLNLKDRVGIVMTAGHPDTRAGGAQRGTANETRNKSLQDASPASVHPCLTMLC